MIDNSVTIYQDSGLTSPAGDGFYSDGVNFYSTSGFTGVLSNKTSCIPPSPSVTPSVSITPSNAATYTVTVYQGNSATRTIGGVSSIVYKLGSGGSKTTLASGITDGTCPGPTLRGTITNVPTGTVLYIGAQIGGTTDQTFNAQNSTSCPGGSTGYCGYVSNPYQITVNSNISVALNLNVSGGAYTTC